MIEKINKVAVLGAGTMGAQLAGHIANAGINVILYDLNNELVSKGLNNLHKMKPSPLYSPKNIELIEICTYDKDIQRLNEVDWVLEAIVEDIKVKHSLYKKITPYLNENILISSNSSGLPASKISIVLPEKFRSRFVLTHFFNPPRYLKLVEVVPSFANQKVVKRFVSIIENILGKSVVLAKDTPNFIANRIGVHGQMVIIKLSEEMKLKVEEVDKIMGPIIGRPKSAVYRTLDIVGLDVAKMVAQNTYENCPKDEQRALFSNETILNKLVELGRFGQKSGEGFYKKTESEILSLDFKTLEYTPKKKISFDGYRLAREQKTIKERLHSLAYSDDKAGHFFWEAMAQSFIYSANRIPEITNEIIGIDNAMKWGYGFELGIFESWDAIGVRKSVNKMIDEGKNIPEWIETMLDTGKDSFYNKENYWRTFYSFSNSNYKKVDLREKEINLLQTKDSGGLVKQNLSASIIDLGERILNIEFHSIIQPTMNLIDHSLASTINEGLDLLESGNYKAMVIGHQGQHFCAGGNLALILEACENESWDLMEKELKNLQDLTQRIRFSKAPVIVSPFGFTLGGGYEISAPATKRICSTELYMGLVEAGVGLIPGAGGNLRFILNILEENKNKPLTPFQLGQKTLETVGFAKVSTSASHALKLGYLRSDDEIIINRDHLIFRSKEVALKLAENYHPPSYRKDIILAGKGSRTAMQVALKSYRIQGKISAHDEIIGKKLAYVITGGNKGGINKPLDEQYILDIEREAFLQLCGEKKTQDRIRFFLTKGKPLRN
ncbi:MAG: 3-hydroxyacyl-CoA dehydrogenase [Candidatus Marinimicrobia bacterium]|nr:3-hydroxyacyl-CoA dehydrogenase [Candidatus Neomarinimicrobiota bacterium]|tara:strand:- start:62780 stop:65122 length:2343 start_codon:yes stop_codon:yes gene_type:complete